jgi:hypothetical protein
MLIYFDGCLKNVFFMAVSTAGLVQAAEEVVYGTELTQDNLEFQVASGGCTEKKDFKIDVVKGITGLPPYLVTLNRINSDNCKMLVPEGVSIKYTRKEVGLEGVAELILTNKIGNTSQHRVVEEKSSGKEDVSNKPISTLMNKPSRVYTTGDTLTEDYNPNRVNIELDKSGNIVGIWLG